MYYSQELYHYGIKGMKWGVRRYQYSDGTLTPSGKRRYSDNKNMKNYSLSKKILSNIKNVSDHAKAKITGKQYVDEFLKQSTTFSRIQNSNKYEKHAFYATYKKKDMDKYLGLFGDNLIRRAKKSTVDSKDNSEVKTKIFQLKFESTKKLKIPSDENVSHIMMELMKKDEIFRNNALESINNAKTKMRRPTQKMLFNQAQNSLKKDFSKFTYSDKLKVYKAFNLSLTNHDESEIAAQNRFYNELKKKGYDALVDYNDKDFSSYHAKKPIIIFDLDTVKLKSVTSTNPKIVKELYKKYNSERIRKEAITNTFGLLKMYGSMKISDASSYVDYKLNNYLS